MKDDKASAKLKKELVDTKTMSKRLRRANPKTGKRLSLRRIAQELAVAGLLSERGSEYNPNAVKRMVEG